MSPRNRSIVALRAWLVAVALLLCVGQAFSGTANASAASTRIDLAATPEVGDPDDESSGTVLLPAGPAVDEGSSGPNVRTRSDRQGSDEIPEAPAPTATPAAEEERGVPRLDDPVLRWLPEIMAASAQWGVPPELIAAVIYVESRGEPGPISPSGARGLMQMMPDGFYNLGIPESLWHDPATNISTGANGLSWRMAAQGSWEGAVGAYLGFGCDVWGTCTDVYVRIVFQWAAHYKPAIDNPRGSGYAILPADWAYGPVAIFQVKGPPPPEEPPSPTPTATGTEEADESTRTPEPGDSTPAPTEPGEPPSTEVPPTAPPPPTEAPPTVVPPTEAPPPPTEPPPADESPEA